MKNLLFILSYFTLILVSCHDETEFKVRRVLINNSGVPVEINVYNSGQLTGDSFTIEKDSQRVDEAICRNVRSLRCDLELQQIGDSALMVFNKEKVLRFCSYYSCPSTYPV